MSNWTEAKLQLTEEHSKRDLARLILRHEQRIAALEAEVARLRDILCEISEPAFDDERLRYVEVQIGREAWEDLKTLRFEDGDRTPWRPSNAGSPRVGAITEDDLLKGIQRQEDK